jgi:hypothetical protein
VTMRKLPVIISGVSVSRLDVTQIIKVLVAQD